MPRYRYRPWHDVAFRFRPSSYPALVLPILERPDEGGRCADGASALASLVLRVAVDVTAPRRWLERARCPAVRTDAVAYHRQRNLLLAADFTATDSRYNSYDVRLVMHGADVSLTLVDGPALYWGEVGERNYRLSGVQPAGESTFARTAPIADVYAGAPIDRMTFAAATDFSRAERELTAGMNIDGLYGITTRVLSYLIRPGDLQARA